MVSAGIDVGMHSIKVVLLNDNLLLVQKLSPCGKYSTQTMVEKTLREALEEAKLHPDEINYTIATGIARTNLELANEFITQPVSIAKASQRISNSIRTVIDMGFVKTLVVKVKDGLTKRIATNDKCAACGGIYLNMVSKILNVPTREMELVSARSSKPVDISSTCAVFAESEIISLINHHAKVEDILKGIFLGIGRRIYPMLLNIEYEPDVAIVGGLAKNSGLVRTMEELLQCKIIVPEYPETVLALGAAIVAQERFA